MGKTDTKAITIRQNGAVAPYIPYQGRKDVGEEVEQPLPEFPTLSYCSGRPAMQRFTDPHTGEVKTQRTNYAGLFLDMEDPALNKAITAMNKACAERKEPLIFDRAKISHQDGPADHWIFPPETDVFLIAKGLQTYGKMKESNERRGLAYGQRKNDQGQWRSFLYAQIIVKPLFPFYKKPMVLCLKSTQSEDGLNLFRAQIKVLRFAHEILQAQNQDIPLPLWGWSLRVGASPDMDTRGKGAGKSSDIFPLIPLIPKDLSVDYLKEQETPADFLDDFRELAEQSVAWSTDLVTKICTRGAERPEQPECGEDEEPFPETQG